MAHYEARLHSDPSDHLEVGSPDAGDAGQAAMNTPQHGSDIQRGFPAAGAPGDALDKSATAVASVAGSSGLDPSADRALAALRQRLANREPAFEDGAIRL